MPLTTRRGSSLGRPVRGFSGGSSGSSRCHCASVTSKRLISPTWAGLPQSATLCRHALGGETTVISHCPRLHGKFLAWNDETLVITSFNWLAASTGVGHTSVAELGVLI